jgi:hypothetical protein
VIALFAPDFGPGLFNVTTVYLTFLKKQKTDLDNDRKWLGSSMPRPSEPERGRGSLREHSRNGAATVRERLQLELTALFVRGCSESTSERSRDREGAVVSSALPLFNIRGSVLAERASTRFSSLGDERSADHGEICAGRG